MSLEKQWKIIQRLAERTEHGLVDWKPTLNDNAFQVSFSSYTLILKEVSSNEAGPDYYVQLLNELGETADVFSDVELSSEFGSRTTEPDKRPFQVLQSLFQGARRKALGADKIIEAILLELDDIPF